MDGPYAQVEAGASPPQISFPRRYNAACDLLDRHVAAGRGDRVAVVDDFGALSYAQLLARCDRVGQALRGLGLMIEQRVVLLMHDTADFMACFLGAMKIGAVPVPVNTLLTSADCAHILQDSRARVVIVSDALLGKLEAALAGLSERPRVVVTRSPPGGEAGELTSRPSGPEFVRLEALCEGASGALAAAETCPDDVAFWLYSSGSTGAPKAAVHLHAHLVRTAVCYAQGVLGLREDDVVYSAAKLFFAYGLGNALTFPLYVGATSVLRAERPTPALVLETLRGRGVTVFGGVPTLFASLLATPGLGVKGLEKLRISLSAGEALPRHIGEQWRARLGSDILDGIGSTEMLHIFLSNRPGDIRYGTSGRAVPGYDLKIVGDDGEPVGDGEEGALWVRGATACAGYFNHRARSLETFHGAWTRTGDRYVRDSDGRYVYSGRGDDMLKVGGIWVSPFEVESALASHPAVLEAAVVGHADADDLIKPRAFVVLKDPATASEALVGELKDFIKGVLAPYKYPRWIEFVGELPKTATGKIQRFRLRG